MKPKAVILSGGPACLPRRQPPRAGDVFDAGVPVLGICYGQMLLAAQLGGKVESGHHREFGRAEVSVKAPSPCSRACGRRGQAYGVDEPWRPHHAIAAGLCGQGASENAPFAAIDDEKRKFYGLMFHPEVVHTPDGAELIQNFVRDIAGCKGDWTMAAFSRRRSRASGRRWARAG